MTANTMARPETTTPRWKAVVYYKATNGLLDIEHPLEELDELQDLVERSPDWNCIDHITITLDRRSYDLTIEEAEAK